ncbi:MAG TPA: protein kinase [Gemmatimonadaceae bacterium]|nr:protein kinase [Gemmatimonadaceae bacterium]
MEGNSALPVQRLRTALEQSYSIDRELGRGGMATVYLAQDVKHDRVVALKVLHPDLAASLGPDRFLREIRLAARLNHPHILPLFDSGEADGILYYVMPYVEGESLRERLDREQQLPIEEAVHHGRAIASALDYAHRQGIVHRDVKPENVMLYEGEAMVMDFGIAKAVSAAGAETLTQTGMMIGTPAYVSPEQAAGETNLDGKSDQYSLACVVYEMITGERPFAGATPQAIMAKRFSETPKPLRALRSAVPESVEKAVSRAMATDGAARYSTTAQFGQALASGNLATPTNTETVPVAIVSAAKSVAVLPFANLSADPDSEYFTDGMADEIINALSKIQSLRVASRTSSFAFKAKSEDIGEIGKKLKVSTVLEGSMRKMGNKLRITAQLVNVADGYQLWSERYDREIEDVFAIQDDISQAIVKALRVILSEGEKKQIEKARVVDVKAYDYYLRGRQYFHHFRRKSLEYARQMFNRAIEIEPEYARAYAGVADACSLLYTYFDARESNLRQADTASRKSIELEPELAEAHVARGIALSMSKRFDEAVPEFETAMRLDPKLFDAAYWYARTLRAQGQYEEAQKLFERASALRPEDYQAPGFQAQVLVALGRRDEAEAQFRRVVRLVSEHLELNPDDPRACILGAIAHAALHDEEHSVLLAERAIAADPDDPMLLYNVACNYSQLGRIDDALGALEQAVDRGYGDKAWMEHDSDLDSLRSTPRYQALLQVM